LFTFGTHTLAFDLNCYQEILVILRLSLSKSANLKPQIIDPKSLESIRDEACLLVDYVSKLSIENLDCLMNYVKIVKEYALTACNPLGIYLLLEICSISLFNLTQILNDNLEWIKNQCFSVNEQVRFYSAELWSLVLVNNLINKHKKGDEVNFESLFSLLLTMNKSILSNESKSFEHKHGCILCIGYTIAKYYSTKTIVDSKQTTNRTSIQILIASIGWYNNRV
jgi:hypothetical protein